MDEGARRRKIPRSARIIWAFGLVVMFGTLIGVTVATGSFGWGIAGFAMAGAAFTIVFGILIAIRWGRVGFQPIFRLYGQTGGQTWRRGINVWKRLLHINRHD